MDFLDMTRHRGCAHYLIAWSDRLLTLSYHLLIDQKIYPAFSILVWSHMYLQYHGRAALKGSITIVLDEAQTYELLKSLMDLPSV